MEDIASFVLVKLYASSGLALRREGTEDEQFSCVKEAENSPGYSE